MIANANNIIELSEAFKVNQEDILLIALNVLGAHSKLSFPRMRFRLSLLGKQKDPLYTIISLGRKNSPFELTKDSLYFKGEKVANVDMLENDDVVIGYFRKNNKVLTLNSNARSQCVGCTFCPNTIEKSADPRFSVLDNLTSYFSVLAKSQGWEDISSLEIITICTGCFLYEKKAIEHIRLVSDAAKTNGFNGKIQILSSVIRSEEGMQEIKRYVDDFKLTLTIECFSNRDVILKKSKADLTLEEMYDILNLSVKHGFDTNYTYIVGLDSLDVAISNLKVLQPVINSFPNFQVYQAHNSFMQLFTTKDALSMEYFLNARKGIENIFSDSNLAPQSWENYRSLWYYSYQDKDLECVRI